MTKVVFVNGPPGSGKDTFAQMLVNRLPRAKHLKFAGPLKEATHVIYATMQLGAAPPPIDSFEGEAKDKPSDFFFGKRPRDAYIAMSEAMLKPLHGRAFFGDLMVKQIRRWQENYHHIVISDCGFQEEVEKVAKAIGKDKCMIVQMHRDQCNFDNDSRDWVEVPGVPLCPIDNSGTKDQLRFLAATLATNLTDAD
jgi:hypothetical protein